MGTNKITQEEHNAAKLFVLLKGQGGNVFWTTNDGSDYKADGFTVLYSGDSTTEMIAQWEKYYNGKYNTTNDLSLKEENESLKAINAEILEALKWVEMKSWQKDEWEDMSIINTYVRAAITKATKQ